MLRITPSVNAAAAKRYFTECLAKGDYYAGETAEPGRWGGAAAKRLGLAGPVDREAFGALADNQHPDGSGRLTLRTKLNRRVGYDFNFHCPKSVSVMHAFTGDERILAAVNRAVDETMEHIEAQARCRVRTGGQQGDRLTENLVWATFVHKTSRPIDGIPDPHLHAHCFTFNATFDPVEGRWKAAEFGEVKRSGAYYEAVFHARLAQLLADAGYSVERRGRFWELSSVPDSVISKFSRRTEQIEHEAERRGITNPEEKAKLGARTRRAKTECRPWAEVRADWDSRLSEDERGGLVAPKPPASPRPPTERSRVAREALDYGLNVMLERVSVAREQSVLEHALRYGVGRVRVEDLRSELGGLDLIRRNIGGADCITTAAVLREEQEMLSFARDGRGTCRPFQATPCPPASLTGSQAKAFEYVLSSRDRVTLIRGPAGAGKTTLMKSVIPTIEETGTKVTVLAPMANVARGLLREAGFADADTVARFLTNEKLSVRARGGVIWLDEAGVLGSRGMGELFRKADELNARLILAGDFRQHGSVDRGDTLRLLETQAGLRSAEIREIRRQRGEYRAAMEALSKGDTVEGFAKLDKLGAIEEIAEAETRYGAVADAYMAACRRGKTALIVSPTHREGDRATEAVRTALRAEGLLGEEREFLQLKSLHLTEAERANPASYAPGMVIQFHKSGGGYRAGARVGVTLSRDKSGPVAITTEKLSTPAPLELASQFDVFEATRIRIAVGDTVRITRNGRTVDDRSAISNGTRHTVAGFDELGHVVLNDGRTLWNGFGHWEHGYTATSYGAQGLSAQRVFVVQSAESYRASSAAQFYVAASRGTEAVTLFTDDKRGLLQAVQRSADRQAATEFVTPQAAALWLARASEHVAQAAEKVADVTLER